MLDAKFSCKLISLLTLITKKNLEFHSSSMLYKQNAVSLRSKKPHSCFIGMVCNVPMT